MVKYKTSRRAYLETAKRKGGWPKGRKRTGFQAKVGTEKRGMQTILGYKQKLFLLPPELIRQIEDHAKKRGITQSETVRDGMVEYFKGAGGKE